MSNSRALDPRPGLALGNLRLAGLLAALLLLAALPRWAEAFVLLPAQRNIAIIETDARNRQLQTLLFDMALLSGGPKIYLNSAATTGRPYIAYEFRLDIGQIVEYTPQFFGQVFDPAVHPVVKSYPAGGQWAWNPLVELSAPGGPTRVFQTSTTDGVLVMKLIVNAGNATTTGALTFSDVHFDIQLNSILLNRAPGNNLAFVGNIASTLQYDNLIDRQGRNVYNCNGQPCFGPRWGETTLTCGDSSPIFNTLSNLPGVVSPGKVKVTGAQTIWTLIFTNVQENPPPQVCVWE
jgi:hypothetical protein